MTVASEVADPRRLLLPHATALRASSRAPARCCRGAGRGRRDGRARCGRCATARSLVLGCRWRCALYARPPVRGQPAQPARSVSAGERPPRTRRMPRGPRDTPHLVPRRRPDGAGGPGAGRRSWPRTPGQRCSTSAAGWAATAGRSAERGFEVRGLDVSEEYVERARGLGVRADAYDGATRAARGRRRGHGDPARGARAPRGPGRAAARGRAAWRARNVLVTTPNCTQSFGAGADRVQPHARRRPPPVLHRRLAGRAAGGRVRQLPRWSRAHPLDELIAELVLPRALRPLYRGWRAPGSATRRASSPACSARARGGRDARPGGRPRSRWAARWPARRSARSSWPACWPPQCEVTLAAPGAEPARRRAGVELLEAGAEDFDALLDALREPRRRGGPAAARPAPALRAEAADPLRGRPLQPARRSRCSRRSPTPARRASTSLGAPDRADGAGPVRGGRLRRSAPARSSATCGSAGWASSGLIDLDAYRHDRDLPRVRRRGARSGCPSEPPQRDAPAAQGRLARHRRRRPGAALGRRDLALAGRAHPDPRRRAAGRPRAGRVHLFFMGVERPRRRPRSTCPRAAGRGDRVRARARPRGPLRALQRRAGCPTRSGPRTCSRPTWGSRPTTTTSRRASPSAPACSTTSGRGCRWCTTGGDSMADLVERERLGGDRRPRGRRGLRRTPASGCSTRPPRTGEARADVAALADAARPLVEFCLDPRAPGPAQARRGRWRWPRYGQYPFIAARRREAEGAGAVARSVGRWAGRAVAKRL